MSLVDLHSDLSKFRKPAPSVDLTKQPIPTVNTPTHTPDLTKKSNSVKVNKINNDISVLINKQSKYSVQNKIQFENASKDITKGAPNLQNITIDNKRTKLPNIESNATKFLISDKESPINILKPSDPSVKNPNIPITAIDNLKTIHTINELPILKTLQNTDITNLYKKEDIKINTVSEDDILSVLKTKFNGPVLSFDNVKDQQIPNIDTVLPLFNNTKIQQIPTIDSMLPLFNNTATQKIPTAESILPIPFANSDPKDWKEPSAESIIPLYFDNTKTQQIPTNANTIPAFTDLPISKFVLSGKTDPLSWPGTIPPAVNFFPDAESGAIGFSTFMSTTKYLGIKGESYTYPNLTINGIRLMNVDQYKLTAQLGYGSPFFKNTGFSDKNTYLDKVGQDGFLGSISSQRHSQSYLDKQYTKHNLKRNSHNSGWIQQPFILTGLQTGGLYPEIEPPILDDGLMRGGTAYATLSSIRDTERITEFLGSPRGILFISKQVGLQLCNPKVESITPALGGLLDTRIYNLGLNTLAQVPVNAFGIHFKRHGLTPTDEEEFQYGNVKDFQNQTDFTQGRIIQLKNDLIVPNEVGDFNKGINKAKNIISKLASLGGTILPANNLVNLIAKTLLPIGNPIARLSGAGGPQSVYGIGYTIINRWWDSRPVGTDNYIFYTITSQYASTLSLIGFGAAHEDQSKNTIDDVDANGLSLITDNYNFDSSKTFNSISGVGNSSVYDTLKYSQLDKDNTLPFNDFRENLDDNTIIKTIVGKLSQAKGRSIPYRDYNRIKTFGEGDWGNKSKDRSDVTAIVSPQDSIGDKVNLLDVHFTNYINVYNPTGSGAPLKDHIKFFFSGPNQMKNKSQEASTDVIVFRATIEKFTDNLNPSWNDIQMLGRADPVYTYKSWARKVSFTFRVAATTKEEMKPMWRKINALTSYTAPSYRQSIMVGPFMRLTVGDYFQETPGFINNLSIDVVDASPWEINLEGNPNLYQLPMVVDINVGFTMIMDFKPQLYGRFFSLSPRGMEAPNANNWLDYGKLYKLVGADDPFEKFRNTPQVVEPSTPNDFNTVAASANPKGNNSVNTNSAK